MQLGAFSVSLTVKDIAVSKAFYEKLGFTYKSGDQSQGWLVLKNGSCVIGLFQGMFDKNLLTFNPGWDSNAKELASFTDVRDIEKHLLAQGLTLIKQTEQNSSGPEHITLEDPDGNPILIDQHR